VLEMRQNGKFKIIEAYSRSAAEHCSRQRDSNVQPIIGEELPAYAPNRVHTNGTPHLRHCSPKLIHLRRRQSATRGQGLIPTFLPSNERFDCFDSLPKLDCHQQKPKLYTVSVKSTQQGQKTTNEHA
jgi:hypothetical protein